MQTIIGESKLNLNKIIPIPNNSDIKLFFFYDEFSFAYYTLKVNDPERIFN